MPRGRVKGDKPAKTSAERSRAMRARQIAEGGLEVMVRFTPEEAEMLAWMENDSGFSSHNRMIRSCVVDVFKRAYATKNA
jgi:hypothetical protein